MSFEELHEKFGRKNPYVIKVQHPLTDLKMPFDGEPAIVQPIDSSEVSANAFLLSQNAADRKALEHFIKDAGQEFWFDRGLLAVGTKLFPPSYWQGVAEDAAKGREAEFTPIITRHGEDLDLILLATDPEAPRNTTWVQSLSERLTRAGVRHEVTDGYKNGTLYYGFTLEIEKHPILKKDVTYVDELPYRHKNEASGSSIIIYYDDACPIHIRQNFAAPAERIIDAERRMGFCFAELFQNGIYQNFLNLLQ